MLDLKHLTGDLLNALGNRPAVLGFERDRPQKVECSLDQIVWLRHTMVIYNKNCRLSRVLRVLVAGVGRPRTHFDRKGFTRADREISRSPVLVLTMVVGCMLLPYLITPYFIIFANLPFPLLPRFALGESPIPLHSSTHNLRSPVA